jgi:hypothetical protein
MFRGSLGEGGSEDLPARFGASGACRRGVGGQVGVASPWPEWLVLVLGGRELFHRSTCPEAVVAAVGAGGGEPLGVRRPAGPLVWGLFIPTGGGTGVPFVMAP